MRKGCDLCPIGCKADRKTRLGYCGAGENIKIAKYYLHKFEEPIICGYQGSGTVFFVGCPLKCVFCQNYELSRNQTGKEISPEELAEIFKELEGMNAANINLVTPTQYVNEIAEAFKIYRPKIPIVYNTSSYETVETLKIIDEFVDIYLPDLKFYSPEISLRYTGKKNYFEIASKAVKFMMESKKREVGEDGQLKQGVIVRHMVMPLCVNDTREVLKWFKENEKNGAYLSLMAQYTPFGEANKYPELKRRITKGEYDRAAEELT
ncbi:MAG: radical SAM protein, partial [Clostridia bacterium]|nr:radical SAM protein [Clostridia bacterium]